MTPGSINWLFDDWVDYPGSIDTVDRLWNDEQFLTFDNAREDWHFRITREDLKKHQLTLREFIAPIHDALEKSTDVKQVKQRRTQVAAN